MRTPFVYIIENKDGQIYVGSRYGANCHPSQLLTSYFTSSKYVKPMIKANPESWRIMRLVECSSTSEAVQIECEWQLEFQHNKLLLNRRVNNGKFINHGPMSDETRQKISKTRTALKIHLSEETKLKLSESSTGRKWADASRQKLSASKRGQSQTIETRTRISKSLMESVRGAGNPNTTWWVLQDPHGNILHQPKDMTGRQWIESLGLSYQYLLKMLKDNKRPTSGKLAGWVVISRQKASK